VDVIYVSIEKRLKYLYFINLKITNGRKSPGEDGVTCEMLKMGKNTRRVE